MTSGQSSTKRLWGVEAGEGPEFSTVHELQNHLNCHPLTAQLFWNRGLRNPQALDLFMRPELARLPDPFSIIDLQKAADRVAEAVTKGEHIAIYGDYDVDGTCGLSLLVDFFRSIGVNVTAYQPNRFSEGYGVHTSALEKIFAQAEAEKNPIRVLISVDCGITAIDPARYCKEKGVDYVVLDHHKIGESLPDAFAVVNPLRPEDTSGLQNLCGAGLAFFFAMGLRSVLRSQGFFDAARAEPNLARLLDLVAIATVADVVDVRGVNRILLTHGLRQMDEKRLGRPIRTGLKALFQTAGIEAPTTRQCGFVIGPRINAAGRLKSAQYAFELLTSTDPETALKQAQELEELNTSRKGAQEEVLKKAREQALAQLEDSEQKKRWDELKQDIPAAQFGPWPRALVLAPQEGEEWHEGVVGIVATRIVEEFGRPAFVLTKKEGEEGYLKGSVRSVSKIDILSAISTESVSLTLTNYGGHAHAGGVTLLRKNLFAFAEALNMHLAITTEQTHFDKQMHHDVDADLIQISPKLVHEFESLEPVGRGFEAPIIKLKKVEPKDVRVLKEKHLKFRLQSGIDAMWFNASGLSEGFDVFLSPEFSHCALWVSPQWNEWQGVKRLQLLVKHAERISII